jgi:hypothetical protein
LLVSEIGAVIQRNGEEIQSSVEKPDESDSGRPLRLFAEVVLPEINEKLGFWPLGRRLYLHALAARAARSSARA